MALEKFSIGVVGASTLLGKELTEEIDRSPLATGRIVLLDDETGEGSLASAGDEATFIQRVDADALERLDVVFFCGTPELTRRFWEGAREAGAIVIDLSRALTATPGVLVWSPALRGGTQPDLQTAAVVPGYGPALMLAMVAERLRAGGHAVREMSATLLVPASEYGRAAMDELHQQTVSLLSFQAVPDEVFGVQSAFNVLSGLGDEAKVSLPAVQTAVDEHLRLLQGDSVPPVAVQVLQAPVFHGYVISLMVELEQAAEVGAVQGALRGPRLRVLAEEGEEPSNAMAAGQDEAVVRVRAAGDGRRFWLTMAADNLRLLTTEAVECALRLRRLRPQGKVQ